MLEHKLSFFSKRYRMQILAALTCHIMYFSHGIGVGWISPTVQILQSTNTPLDFPVNVDEVSWIGSMFGLGFFIGNIFFSITVNRLTHKWNMYLLALPHILCWVMNYFVQSVEYIYAGRFFAGLTSGGIFTIFPLFTSEILDKEIRGALMSVGMLLISAGILVGFILPVTLNFYVTPCMVLVLPISYYLLLCFFPETPHTLLKRNRLKEAEASFNFYKGIDSRKKSQPSTGAMESKTTCGNLNEFEGLRAIIMQSDSRRSLNFRDFVEKPSLKAFANAIVLCLLYQTSGSFAFVTYMNSIFEASGSAMNSNIATYIVGSVHIVGIAFATFLIERFGRRPLLFSSLFCMSVGMYGFGGYVQFLDAATRSQFDWAPLAFMMVVVFASALGLFGNVFIIIVEIFPAKIRSPALSLSMIFISILLFAVLKVYPYFLFNFGITVTMYTSASCCVIAGIYLFIFLPETKGKSMEKPSMLGANPPAAPPAPPSPDNQISPDLANMIKSMISLAIEASVPNIVQSVLNNTTNPIITDQTIDAQFQNNMSEIDKIPDVAADRCALNGATTPFPVINEKAPLGNKISHILTFSHGISIGWLSPILYILQSPQTPLDFKVTATNLAWIGSIFGIGALCGNVLLLFSLNRFGRKRNMCALAIPHMLFWILNYFALSVDYLYAARFFVGVTSGGLYVIGPIFISEITEKEIRGALTSMAMMFLSCGILVGYILPSYLNYHLIPCIVIGFPLIYMTAMAYFPDTPTSLLHRRQVEEARASFNFYRNIKSERKSQQEMCINEMQISAINSEFEELVSAKLQGEKCTPITYHDFFNKSALKKFALAFVIIILNQFSGSFAFVNYMSHIFAESSSTMDPKKSTIIIGLVQIFGTLLASTLVDRFGRKTLILLSTAGMAIGMFFFGTFVQYTSAATKAQFDWIPLLAVAFIIATASIGVISLTFTIIVEILPAKVRPESQSITMMFCSFLMFVTLKLYPYFLFNLGISITMYACAGCCVVAGTYLLLFLPETKGKSMAKD
ncbi:uncharacterized protein [Eurosta solidaginis]|uniref:uncharacterized protein n=1 Tax=Eurosta solidaginis TaxID=178769 RepID=UPI00353146C4